MNGNTCAMAVARCELLPVGMAIQFWACPDLASALIGQSLLELA